MRAERRVGNERTRGEPARAGVAARSRASPCQLLSSRLVRGLVASPCHKRLPKRLNERVNECVGDLPCDRALAHPRVRRAWRDFAWAAREGSDHDRCRRPSRPAKQLLHLVFGGELKSLARRRVRQPRRRSTSSASIRATRRPTRPGRRWRNAPSTTRTCATSLSTSTACSIPTPRRRRARDALAHGCPRARWARSVACVRPT